MVMTAKPCTLPQAFPDDGIWNMRKGSIQAMSEATSAWSTSSLLMSYALGARGDHPL